MLIHDLPWVNQDVLNKHFAELLNSRSCRDYQTLCQMFVSLESLLPDCQDRNLFDRLRLPQS